MGGPDGADRPQVAMQLVRRRGLGRQAVLGVLALALLAELLLEA